jgi:hypothetical protein
MHIVVISADTASFFKVGAVDFSLSPRSLTLALGPRQHSLLPIVLVFVLRKGVFGNEKRRDL